MIKIGEKYVIEATPDCYTVKYLNGNKPRVDKKTGKTTDAYEIIGYFGKLSGAFLACRDDKVRRRISEENFTTKEAVNMIREVTTEFEERLKDEMKGA